jgi:hypothetical protein
LQVPSAQTTTFFDMPAPNELRGSGDWKD